MKKSEAEIKLMEERYKTFPKEYMPRTKNKKSSPANELTTQIIALVNSLGGSASRVNSQGNYNQKLGRFTFSGSTKGAADISAIVQGRSLQIEVKDRSRQTKCSTSLLSGLCRKGRRCIHYRKGHRNIQTRLTNIP